MWLPFGFWTLYFVLHIAICNGEPFEDGALYRVVAKDVALNTTYRISTVNILSMAICLKKCLVTSDCRSVNFSPSDLACELNSGYAYTLTDPSLATQRQGFSLIQKNSFAMCNVQQDPEGSYFSDCPVRVRLNHKNQDWPDSLCLSFDKDANHAIYVNCSEEEAYNTMLLPTRNYTFHLKFIKENVCLAANVEMNAIQCTGDGPWRLQYKADDIKITTDNYTKVLLIQNGNKDLRLGSGNNMDYSDQDWLIEPKYF